MDRIDTLVHDAYATVAALVQPLLDTPADIDAFRRADRRVDETVATEPSYAGYRRLRLESAIEAFSGIAAGLCGFPDGSDERVHVRDVVRSWTRAIGGDRARGRRADIIETFDTGYARRRIRFLIERLDRIAGGGEHDGAPRRGDLESAMRDLDALHGDLVAAIDAIARPGATSGAGGRAARAAKRLLLVANDDAAWSLEASREDIDAAVAAIGALVRESLPDPPGQGFDTLAHASEGWRRDVRQGLMVAYTGFPLWDALSVGSAPAGDAEPVVRLETNEHILVLLSEEATGRPAEAVVAIRDRETPGRPAGHLRAVPETEPDPG